MTVELRNLAFASALVANVVLTAIAAVIAYEIWGNIWGCILIYLAWLAYQIWCFREFGLRAAWGLMALLAFNPATVFFFLASNACAVNGGCI